MNLSPGDRHKDVPRAKRRLIRWLSRHGHERLAQSINPKIDRYGPRAVRGCRVFQAAKGLEVDGVLGPITWAALTGEPRRLDKRERMKAWMTWALANEPSFHYRQSRPIPLRQLKAKRLPVYTDCSGSTTGCHHAAGAADPNGRGYDGSGYTGTLRSACERITLAEARIGDFIVYGPGTGAHVTVIYADAGSSNPLTFSHGQESGPRLYRHSVEVGVHDGYFTVHRAKV